MDIGDVHEQHIPILSTVRHTCPIKNGAGDGLFFTVRKDKTLYKLYKMEKRSFWKNYLQGITRSIEESGQ